MVNSFREIKEKFSERSTHEKKGMVSAGLNNDNLSVEIYEEEWDRFVTEHSVNGTFLQTRRFLNYHPRDRFEDASYIVRDKKGAVVAVCPACIRIDQGKKVLYSHMGSTYGGIIISTKWYKTNKAIEIVKCLENKWRDDGFDKVSWGIVTEDMGQYLNEGLVDSKEAFGSKHTVNITYEKSLNE